MLLCTWSTPCCLRAYPSSTADFEHRSASVRGVDNSPASKLLLRVALPQSTSQLRCGSAKFSGSRRNTHTTAARRALLTRNSVAADTGISYCNTTDTEHLKQASVLRANAYYEEQPQARYTGTFKRQFADQSTRVLKEQTSGNVPECVCMVALQLETEQVLATCDVRPPANIASQHPQGVPRSDASASYITNVAVDPKTRGQGIGFRLLEAAAAHAYEEWQAAAVYTTVDTNNEVSNFAVIAKLYAQAQLLQLT